MRRQLLFVSLLAAIGCGGTATSPPQGGAGGAGGFGGDGGADGEGGEGGTGGVVPTAEMFSFYVPDVDCWFWDPACDPALGGGMSFNTDHLELTYLEGIWWVWRGEQYVDPDVPPILPDRVEVCFRKEYEDKQVIKVVGQCFDAEWEVIADGRGLSVLVGSGPYVPVETWWYAEVRLYYDLPLFECWRNPDCDDFSHIELCPTACAACHLGYLDQCIEDCTNLHLTGELHASEFMCDDRQRVYFDINVPSIECRTNAIDCPTALSWEGQNLFWLVEHGRRSAPARVEVGGAVTFEGHAAVHYESQWVVEDATEGATLVPYVANVPLGHYDPEAGDGVWYTFMVLYWE